MEPIENKISELGAHNKSNKSNENSVDSLSDSVENGQELCIHDGVLLKYASAEFIAELNTSGALSLVQYSGNRLFVEWRPNDSILITDEDAQDQEWSLVDTISKRHRTRSESKAFNTKYESPPKPRILRVLLSHLKSIEVLSKGQTIRLLKKSDGSMHSEYFFQHGNADMFVKDLQHRNVVVRSQTLKHVYEILDADAVKLKKTFAELQIDEIKESGGWLTNVVWRNMELLAKVSDYVQPHQQSPTRNPSPNKSDEYEVLNQEKSDSESRKEGESTPEVETNTMTVPVLPPRKITPRGSPLTEKQWREFQTEDGRVSDAQRVKEVIFRGGVENHLRAEVWKYLLNYYQWEETAQERCERRRRKITEYYQMKTQWLSMTVAQERNFSGYRDRKCQIEKDVKRTDRTQEFFAGEENPNLTLLQDILMTYVMYNFDLGYVQGMSDLLAPILWLMRNEADAFWCFVGFMDVVFSNFDIDQAGMKRQLGDLNLLLGFCNHDLFNYLKEHGSENMYFCFRWLLVWFKREFSIDDIMQLWEVLWTGLPCPNYHLFISVAVLDEQMSTIVENKFEFNEILKHVNELSMNINLSRTLEVAEAIYTQIKEAEDIPNEIRIIIGEEPINVSEDQSNDGDAEVEDFADIVNEPTKEELAERQRKLEEACEQSMFLSFM